MALIEQTPAPEGEVHGVVAKAEKGDEPGAIDNQDDYANRPRGPEKFFPPPLREGRLAFHFPPPLGEGRVGAGHVTGYYTRRSSRARVCREALGRVWVVGPNAPIRADNNDATILQQAGSHLSAKTAHVAGRRPRVLDGVIEIGGSREARLTVQSAKQHDLPRVQAHRDVTPPF